MGKGVSRSKSIAATVGKPESVHGTTIASQNVQSISSPSPQTVTVPIKQWNFLNTIVKLSMASQYGIWLDYKLCSLLTEICNLFPPGHCLHDIVEVMTCKPGDEPILAYIPRTSVDDIAKLLRSILCKPTTSRHIRDRQQRRHCTLSAKNQGSDLIQDQDESESQTSLIEVSEDVMPVSHASLLQAANLKLEKYDLMLERLLRDNFSMASDYYGVRAGGHAVVGRWIPVIRDKARYVNNLCRQYEHQLQGKAMENFGLQQRIGRLENMRRLQVKKNKELVAELEKCDHTKRLGQC